MHRSSHTQEERGQSKKCKGQKAKRSIPCSSLGCLSPVIGLCTVGVRNGERTAIIFRTNSLEEFRHGTVGSHTPSLFVARFKLRSGALRLSHDIASKVLDPVGKANSIWCRPNRINQEAQSHPNVTLHDAEKELYVIRLEAEVFVHVLDRRPPKVQRIVQRAIVHTQVPPGTCEKLYAVSQVLHTHWFCPLLLPHTC